MLNQKEKKREAEIPKSNRNYEIDAKKKKKKEKVEKQPWVSKFETMKFNNFANEYENK